MVFTINNPVRLLAFGLGVLLLFHGLDKMIHGTEHIQKMILDMHVPSVEKSVPFGSWFSPFMPGTVFMGKVFVGKEFVNSMDEIKLLSYGVYIPELIVPILLIFGRLIRIMATIIALYMMFILVLAYRTSPDVLIEFGGWTIEVVVLYLIASLILIFKL